TPHAVTQPSQRSDKPPLTTDHRAASETHSEPHRVGPKANLQLTPAVAAAATAAPATRRAPQNVHLSPAGGAARHHPARPRPHCDPALSSQPLDDRGQPAGPPAVAVRKRRGLEQSSV